MTSWDTTRVKAQLRLTAQRLGQLQDKLDSQGQIMRRDIATLLQQGNFALARAKAQKLVREDVYADLLQTLEMHVGVISEHIVELEHSDSPGPVVVESASSIIFAAPRTESRDLHVVRDLLIQRLGPDFARSAIGNNDNYVSSRVIRAVSAQPPSAGRLDQYLYSIAKHHGVQWMPDLQPHEKVNAISEMLDPVSTAEIDLPRLRELCSHGLPEYPPWLRPRVWRLLLGTLPVHKTTWNDEARKQRDNYYDLIRRLLEPFSSLPPPTSPLSSLDAALVDVSKGLTQVPSNLFSNLEEGPDESNSCPLDDSAPNEIRISCAESLDVRLRAIRDFESKDENGTDSMPEVRLEGTPEIRLEGVDSLPENTPELRLDPSSDPSTLDAHLEVSRAGTPEISLSAPDSPSSSNSAIPTTLLASKAYTATGAHPKHASALLRLLYVHSRLNPANQSPQIASLLVPLYTALVEEAEPDSVPHVEADTFWLFEAMVGEFSELEDVDSENVWRHKFGQRLNWADTELFENLQVKGLDPALPHYSYRWLTALLTHTLPLPAVLTVWDALFSRPGRERDSSPKLEYLVDVCTSMLISARSALFLLGRHDAKSVNLWRQENAVIPTSELGARELEDAFVEGMALLQKYPLKNIGGIEGVLQMAFDLARRREAEQQAGPATGNAGLGARLRDTVWKSFGSQNSILESHEPDEDTDSDEGEPEQEQPAQNGANPSTPQRSAFSSRLAATVWRGITNQSAMETPSPPTSPPASPQPAVSVLSPPPDTASSTESATNGPTRAAMIWGYAEKLRESDTAATLAKVSTNWRVKALDAWNKRGSNGSSSPSLFPIPFPTFSDYSSRRDSIGSEPSRTTAQEDSRRSSLPPVDRSDVYSPPARPAFFRPPRDSWMPPPRDAMSPLTPEVSPLSDTGSDGHKKHPDPRASVIAMQSRTPSPHSAARSGPPRPLLLSSSSLITTTTSIESNSSSPGDRQWADAVRARRPPGLRQGSQSSISSLSPSDHPHSAGLPRRSQMSSESVAGESRVVPLNRKTPSPMARGRRQASVPNATWSPSQQHRRQATETIPSSGSNPPSDDNGSNGVHAENRDSSTTLPSPPLPRTPLSASKMTGDSVRVIPPESQRGSVVLSEFGEANGTPPVPKVLRKSAGSLARLQIEDTSDSSTTQLPARSARVRSKRYPARLATSRTRENSKTSIDTTLPALSPNTLAPEAQDDYDAPTPRAAHFDPVLSEIPISPQVPRRARKISTEAKGEQRTRKLSGEGRARKISGERPRKISTEGREPKHKRESAAVEGDDEGYDDLLSAYESEDGVLVR